MILLNRTSAVSLVRLRLEPGSALASVRPGPVRDAGGVPAGAEALPAGRVARVHRAAVRDTAPGATVLVSWCALAPDQKLKYFNFGFYISPSLLWQWQCRFFFKKKYYFSHLYDPTVLTHTEFGERQWWPEAPPSDEHSFTSATK